MVATTTATTMLNVPAPVTRLRGVGPAAARDLRVLGVQTAHDLLEQLPSRHETYGPPVSIASIRAGRVGIGQSDEAVLVRARLTALKSRRSFRRSLTVQEGLLTDQSGSLAVAWFNQPWLAQLQSAQELVLRGRVRNYRGTATLVSPEIVRDPVVFAGGQSLVPVYPLSGRLTQRQLRNWVRQALPLLQRERELLPPELLTRHKLMSRALALRELHVPSSADTLNAARRRMTFEELLTLSLFVLRERLQLQQVGAVPIPIDRAVLKRFVASLPFTLTQAQRKASWQIIRDMALPHPMNRLLEGDVGSGKTVVAAMALLSVALARGQAVVLAPTVVLARQHTATLRALLKPFNIGVGLLAGPTLQDGAGHEVSRATLLKQLSTGRLQVLVATHAVLQPVVKFKRLLLFAVDEQHRFGVQQRRALKSKAAVAGQLPHLLSMTATPIPRSLALTLYGDLDLSVLDEKPAGRPTVATRIIPPRALDEAFALVRAAVRRGEQAFIMYPLIEDSDEVAARAVLAELPTLKRKFKGLRVGLLHGKLPEDQKLVAMEQFRAGRTHILAATPVIEVGIDIANATTMLIMSAERFGLAQLHQLRGRIGRGTEDSTCLLCPDSATPATRKRLDLMVRSHDGFALAEADLELRGPGEPFGTRQHGQVKFKYATVFDARTLAAVKEEATALLRQDKTLSRWPLLRTAVANVATQLHLE